MSKYRNRYFLCGVLLVLFGIQFRMVQSFVLSETTTKVLAKVTKTKVVADNTIFGSMVTRVNGPPKKRITPPRWFGLAMICIGSVICLHSFAIPAYKRD